MNSLLALIAVILGIINLIMGSKKSSAERRVRELEKEHHDEKLKIIQKERDAARDRLRDYLNNYRGPEGKA